MTETTNNQGAKVALIGRTNVGKSTLFNKLTGEQSALVSKIAGTTRDRNYGECLWLGKSFTVVDTAGLDVSTEKNIDKQAIAHAKLAIKEADLILFLVDAKAGILPQDKEYARLVKQSKKPFILAANKVDSRKQMDAAAEFLKLGLNEPMLISAATGAGTGDLLDQIFSMLKKKLTTIKEQIKPDFRITIAGKPNVGKSSLFNTILGEEKSIVSQIAHTTRDSQDINLKVNHKNKDYILQFIDTAGIRKKGKVSGQLEKQGILQSLGNIKKADLVLLLIDPTEKVSAQDKNISQAILEANKSLIFVINKWDLVEDKSTQSAKEFEQFIYRSFPYLTWAPVVFVSAKTGEKVPKLINSIFEIYEKQQLDISDKELEKFLKYIIKKQPPRKSKGTKPPYIFTIKQTRKQPMTFEIKTDQPKNIHFSYMRFIKNKLREKYKLEGIGIRLKTVKGSDHR